MNCSSEMWLGISGRAGTHDGGEKGIVIIHAKDVWQREGRHVKYFNVKRGVSDALYFEVSKARKAEANGGGGITEMYILPNCSCTPDPRGRLSGFATSMGRDTE